MDTQGSTTMPVPEVQEARVEVYRQMLQLKDPKLLPYLHKMLSDKNSSIRKAAAISIRQIAEGKSEQEMTASIPHMIQCLDDEDGDVRHFAATTLNAVLGHPELDGKLLTYTADEIDEVANFWKTWWQTEDAAKYKTAQAFQ
jgi:HEAT repeat protein